MDYRELTYPEDTHADDMPACGEICRTTGDVARETREQIADRQLLDAYGVTRDIIEHPLAPNTRMILRAAEGLFVLAAYTMPQDVDIVRRVPLELDLPYGDDLLCDLVYAVRFNPAKQALLVELALCDRSVKMTAQPLRVRTPDRGLFATCELVFSGGHRRVESHFDTHADVEHIGLQTALAYVGHRAISHLITSCEFLHNKGVRAWLYDMAYSPKGHNHDGFTTRRALEMGYIYNEKTDLHIKDFPPDEDVHAYQIHNSQKTSSISTGGLSS